MRVHYLSSSVFPVTSANAIQVSSMCSAFAANDVDVSLIGFGAPSDELTTARGVRFFGRRMKSLRVLGTLLDWPRIQTLLKRERPDFVYARCPYLMFLATRCGFRGIYEVHHPPRRALHALVERRILGSTSTVAVAFITDSLRAWYRRRFPSVEHAPWIVLPDGAFPDPRASDTLRDNLKETVCLKIGYFGSAFRGKGVEWLLHLAPLVPQHQFHIFSDLQERDAPPIENCVFHKPVSSSDVYQEMRRCDVLVLPNRRSVYTRDGINIGAFTSPLKLFEYFAVGRPVLASNISPLTEILRHGENAHLADVDDEEAWVSALEVLCREPAYRESLARCAHKELIDKYSWSMRAKRVIALLEGSLQGATV